MNISTTALEDEIFKKIEKASRTTLTFNGNALTITGTPHNVEHTKVMVEVIAHNLNPVVPDRLLPFRLLDESIKIRNQLLLLLPFRLLDEAIKIRNQLLLLPFRHSDEAIKIRN
jgi:rRNA processing protein Krr1/Pno1